MVRLAAVYAARQASTAVRARVLECGLPVQANRGRESIPLAGADKVAARPERVSLLRSAMLR